MKLTCLHDGGRYFEGPRWHAGRLWFVDCMDRTLLSLAPSGECEQHAKFDDDTPCGLGVLPDGRLIVLTMFRKRLFAYADGKLSLYADLSRIATGTIDDMIVDGLGRAYVRDLGIDVPGRRAIACVLGGEERRTLFCLSAATSHEELRQRKSSAQIDVVEVEVAGAGNP